VMLTRDWPSRTRQGLWYDFIAKGVA